jgi:uncharacterized protein (DUF302 family)
VSTDLDDRAGTGYTLRVETALPYADAVARTREALAAQGFGVLTEIDVRATLKDKLDVDVPAEVILGACRPGLAHRAMTAAPGIAALLPCNVVVRDTGTGGTVVEAVDPDAMARVENHPTIAAVAAEARVLLGAALRQVASEED